MRVLIVGGGAVGQVYGYHLAQAGVEIGFYLKPEHVREAMEGFQLYPLSLVRRPRTVEFSKFDIFTTPEEAGEYGWNYVILTVPSTALGGSWLPGLVQACPGAVFVSLHSGPADREMLTRVIPANRFISALISMISYQAPLPGEKRFAEPGIAYWLPPAVSVPLSGESELVGPLAEAFRKGGINATQVGDVWENAVFLSAILMPLLVALERNDWKFASLGKSDLLGVAVDAGKEAMNIMASSGGYSRPLTYHVVRKQLMKLVLSGSSWFVPLNLETYLEYHFTKVRGQTLMYMDSYIANGRAAGLPVESLETLVAGVD